jgi:hypothetical protein
VIYAVVSYVLVSFLFAPVAGRLMAAGRGGEE